MKFEFFVAVRYLRARRKQVIVSFVTLVSVLGVMTGVAALIVILAMYAGMTQDLQRKILGVTAHISLRARDERGIPDYRTLIRRVAAMDGVLQVSPAIYVQAFATTGTGSSGVVLKGIDPAAEDKAMAVFLRMRSGKLADLNDDRRVIMGRDLATRLGVVPGSAVTMIVPRGTLSPLGIVPRIHRYRVAGVFETGLFDLDSNWGLVSLDQGRWLSGIPPGAVQALELRVRDIYRVVEIQKQIRQALGDTLDSTNWIEMNRPLFSALKLEKWGMFLAIALIVLVAALNIVTTLILMVMEKNRDIAILRAMGATRGQIMKIFILQGLLIGFVGTALGNLLGVSLAIACDHYRWIHLDAQVYFIPFLPFQVRPEDVFLVSLCAMIISLLATIYPSRQAAAVDPVEAIRYE